MLAEDNNDPEAMERKWNEALEIFEARTGKYTPNQIESFVREIRFTHCETHSNHYPASNSEAEKRIQAKTLDMKVWALNEALIEFEEKYGARARAKIRPGCAEIEDRVIELRKLLDAMQLENPLTIEFRDNINRHARGGLIASGVSEDMIPVLLGTGQRKSEAASLTAALNLQ